MGKKRQKSSISKEALSPENADPTLISVESIEREQVSEIETDVKILRPRVIVSSERSRSSSSFEWSYISWNIRLMRIVRILCSSLVPVILDGFWPCVFGVIVF
ncbi:hypothetical protein Tcan_11031 [Toxocara canis]|uniref:Uncharacterized protein n=1 Tax=Toxocara canis TaxID=6265 RepID=A0A0B2W2Z7_TOXCA|nr:hypothetical protein Tcan_11031 [Toxocara canis]